ncbi:MAG: HlyD family efflux transporter periplasmic adaptor subunit [Ruminococcus sp.]
MDSNSRTMHILLVVLSIAIIATIGTIFYHFIDTEYKTETAVAATAEQSETFQGVYVRDETVLTYNGSGAISYNVPDGGKVEKNGIIAEIYADQSAIETNQQIATLQQELSLLNRISNPGILQNAQPAELADQVERYYNQITYCKDCGDLTGLQSAKNDFQIALSAYQLVINQGTENFSQQIAAVSEKIATLENSKQSPRDTVKASSAVYFVSYADGYETKLTTDQIDEITIDDVKAVQNNNGLQSETIVGKTIDSYGWYMVGIIDNSTLKYQVDDTVTLKLANSGATAEAVITDLRTEENLSETLVVLYCNYITSDFVKNRAERVEIIKGVYEGIQVPRSAIRFKEIEETSTNVLTGEEITTKVNYRGVYVMDGEEVVFRKLDVVYEGDDYVLSSLNAGDGYLILYDSIIVEGIDVDGE